MLTDDEIDFYLRHNRQEDDPSYWQAIKDLQVIRRDLQEVCQELVRGPKEMLEVMRRQNIVIADINDPMQKYVMTIYTKLVVLANRGEVVQEKLSLRRS